MTRWGQELHVVNMREAPIFSMDSTIPVSLEYVLLAVFFRSGEKFCSASSTYFSFPCDKELCGHQKAFLSLQS